MRSPLPATLLAVLVSPLGFNGPAHATMAESQKIVREGRNECRAGFRCSPSVGFFAYAEANEWRTCTATLVAPDLIATAAHCVPADSRRPGADCRGRAYLHFAPDKAHPEYEARASCESVVSLEGAVGDGDQPDYAFLKISRVSARPFLSISREGFGDEETFLLDKVDRVPTKGAARARQRSLSCRAFQHTRIAPRVTSEDAQTAFLSDCEERIDHGNSGSALRDARGNVRGVLFGIVDASGKKVARTDLAGKGAQLPKELPDFVFVANYACLDLPGELRAPPAPSGCEAPAPKNRSQSQADDMILLEANAVTGDARYSLAGHGWFQWKLTLDQDRVFYKPTCVRTGRATFERKEATGLVDLRLQVALDKYGRYEKGRLSALPGPPQVATIGLPQLGVYPVQVGARRYSLPACN